MSSPTQTISRVLILGMLIAITACSSGSNEAVQNDDLSADNSSSGGTADGGDSGTDDDTDSVNLDGYTLVWQEEFDGTELNANDWNYEFGDGTEFDLPAGWGNDELQIYTSNSENVSLGIDGDVNVLKITAREDGNGGYTSSRITTEDKISVRYGKIVARIKLPESQGIWPAFWILLRSKWPPTTERTAS